MSLEELRDKASEKYYPSQAELDEAQQLYEKISGFIQRKEGLETHFAGSAGRGTCMKNDKDVDVFILFPEGTEREELEEKGLEIGEKVFKEFGGEYHVDYAEHPYTKGLIEGFEVEIVPCIDTPPDNIQTAVDRTPHHSRWVSENLSDRQKRDVVVLKAFLREKGLYGSSLKVEGFSGYLCEVLVAEYGGFPEVVEAAVNWSRGELVAPREPEKDFDGFTVVDPVDPERNVAAVLSTENLSRFIFECGKLREQPAMEEFLEENGFSELALKQEIKKRAETIVIEFDRPEEVDDIVYPQMRKLARRLEAVLSNHEFDVFTWKAYADGNCRILIEAEGKERGIRELQGPSVFHGSDHVREFREKYSNTYIKDDRVVAKVERGYMRPAELVKEFLKDDPEALEEKGVPGGLSENVSGFRLVDPLSGGDEWLKFLWDAFEVRDES